MSRILAMALLVVLTTGCPYPPAPLPEHPRGAQTAEARAVPPPTSGDETDGPTQPRTAAQRPPATEEGLTPIGAPR
jgi:hypothetical protein